MSSSSSSNISSGRYGQRSGESGDNRAPAVRNRTSSHAQSGTRPVAGNARLNTPPPSTLSSPSDRSKMMNSGLMQQKLNDVALTPGPDDSVSKLEFSPTADFLAVASWDSQVGVRPGCFIANWLQRRRQPDLLPFIFLSPHSAESIKSIHQQVLQHPKPRFNTTVLSSVSRGPKTVQKCSPVQPTKKPKSSISILPDLQQCR